MSRKVDAEIAIKLYGWMVIEGRGRQYLMPSPCLDVEKYSWETNTGLGFWYPRDLLSKFTENRAAAIEAMDYLDAEVEDWYNGEAKLTVLTVERDNETEVKYSIFGIEAIEVAPTFELAICYSILEILEIINSHEAGDLSYGQTSRED